MLGAKTRRHKNTVYHIGQPLLGFQVETEANCTEGTKDMAGWDSIDHRRHQEKRNPIFNTSVMTPIAL